MTSSLPNFTSSRVLVAGDLMLDRYWYGPASRISPEAPVPVVLIRDNEERAGGAGNVALNISAVGANATVLGMTGTDSEAEALKTLLSNQSVECVFEGLAQTSTITKLRVISQNQQLIRMDFESGFHDSDHTAFNQRYESILSNSDVIVLSDYGKGTLQDIPALIAAANKAGKPVLVDPKGFDFEIYRGATTITPNLSEFEHIVGTCPDTDTVVRKGHELLVKLNLETLLITRGEQGMTLLQRNEDPFHLPTHAREVFDVTGAGDTVIGVLAASLGAGESFRSATRFANLAAGIVVGKLGTATTSQTELQDSISKGSADGVLSEKQLLRRVEMAKENGERIVVTNGCFDILHAGHTRYLQEAKDMGDRLIVAVNDDASVARLKGDSRPVNTLNDRMEVLAALQSVDWVIPFSEDTPERIICEILPALLVKGGDYQPTDIAGYDCVKKNGGDVCVVQYEEGLSTSAIINSIKKDES